MIDFNNNIYLGVASPNMERDLSNYYTKAQTIALVDTKQDIITGAASTITDSNLTTNRAVISNASGKVAVSNVTSTELGYLSGVTSEVQKQLNNKASTSLDNLSSVGQMIIDSQNGTISNCILEIPQNIKVTLENNVLTAKSGSVLTDSGATYQTITITSDKTITIPIGSNNRWLIFATRSGVLAPVVARACVSGTTDSLAGQPIHIWFDTTNREVLYYGSDGTTGSHRTYPLCVIDVVDGVASFAKDSNGNDMIFNGAGFIGHHAFIYPDVKALIPNGFNDNGSLKSVSITRSALTIKEIIGNRYFAINSATSINDRPSYFEVDTLDDLYAKNLQGFYYVKSINQCYSWVGSSGNLYPYNTVFISVKLSGTTVTDFTIRQPYQGARNLFTDDLYKQMGDVETLLAAI